MMEFINLTKREGLQILRLCRPGKKNALNIDMMRAIPILLQEAAEDSEIVMLALTGEGDYFTSGNDLSNFMTVSNFGADDLDMQQLSVQATTLFHDFVAAFINFPKPLVAVVNGNAIGIGVTILGLFDYVFASDLATFYCPFTSLGQTLEGCSSFTFPLMMGFSKASAVLLFGRKISCLEAHQCNLVTEIIPHKQLEVAWTKLQEMALLPNQTLINSKGMLRKNYLHQLHKANDDECDTLKKQWTSDEFITAILKFMMKKSKL